MNIKPLLALLLAMGATPAWADPPSGQPPSAAMGRSDGPPPDPAGREAHRRLRGDLEGYSQEAYPDRERVEERRQRMRERMKQRLHEADRDHDGAISRGEADSSMPGLARHFDRIDGNGDGNITRDEMKNARERLREMRRQKRGEGGR